ncbi:hypothetical protein [Streptomyces sp. TLI_185]|uniref:hypothetical protein n=1 Tax=Streptomyces sp. TLI_185 TaxID=2485151 RepID=UPI000FC39ECC|nr:hypothetical protein [Streptomyces sp. TLI_185]RPF34685.1 hypothetical protein EDD92_4659 [Streptomyces sp. TLI_185]
MSTHPLPPATGEPVVTARRRAGARSAWRPVMAATLLAAAAALGTAAPVHALPAATQRATVSAWISDGWGGGTVTSNPAGINCHTTAWDPYAEDAQPQPNPSGPCEASFPVGTTITFTATPDPGSNVNFPPDPNPLTVRAGYNAVWAMFCPNDGLCMSY